MGGRIHDSTIIPIYRRFAADALRVFHANPARFLGIR